MMMKVKITKDKKIQKIIKINDDLDHFNVRIHILKILQMISVASVITVKDKNKFVKFVQKN